MSGSALLPRNRIVFSHDNGTLAITTGLKKCIEAGFNGMITGWTLISDDAATTAGAIVVDVYKDTYANYPPLVGTSMPGVGTKPTITATNIKGQGNTANWSTVSFSAGDIFRFNVVSCTDIKSITLILEVIPV